MVDTKQQFVKGNKDEIVDGSVEPEHLELANGETRQEECLSAEERELKKRFQLSMSSYMKQNSSSTSIHQIAVRKKTHKKGPYSTVENLEISTAYLISNSTSKRHHMSTDPSKWRDNLEHSSSIETAPQLVKQPFVGKPCIQNWIISSCIADKTCPDFEAQLYSNFNRVRTVTYTASHNLFWDFGKFRKPKS